MMKYLRFVLFTSLVCLSSVATSETLFFTEFGRNEWNPEDWIFVKSPRWDYIGQWVQQDNYIQNLTPPDAKPDKLIGIPCAYMSMVRREPYNITKKLAVTTRMESDYDQGPQIVLAPELGQDENGYPEYREHYEVVLFARGINIWHHSFKDGKPEWHLAAYSRFPLERRTAYDLKVQVETPRISKGADLPGKTIVVSVDGENVFAYHEPELADKLYVGIIGYASINRFHFFRVEEF